jgi:TonB-dependent receptor
MNLSSFFPRGSLPQCGRERPRSQDKLPGVGFISGRGLRRPFLPPRLLVPLFLSLLVSSVAAAEASGTGTIQGRILSPATREYLRNVEVVVVGTNVATFTADDGFYTLANVPAGERDLAVSYTGYDPVSARVTVTPGGTATRDFELALSGPKAPGTGAAKDTVVTLGQFVVSSEREGNAKAIMDQRAALNLKSVIASDNFGDITGGNIGEFIKYVPGVVIDYSQSDARSVRIGGLDPKYVGVSVDGMRMASAASAGFGADSRQFEFEQASINSVEAIEVNKTLTARMDADSPAGSINLRSKSAFDRKGREIVAQLTLSANEYQMTLHRVPSPTNALRRVTVPGGVFSFSDVYAGKLGVQLNLGSSTIYGEQEQITHAYDFSNAARGPVITGLTFKDAPKIIERQSLGLNLDYKITPRLVLSLRTTGSHLSDEFVARQYIFTANIAQIDPASTLTRIIALPTANANTRLDTAANHRNKRNDTMTYSTKLEYQRGDLTLTAGGGYSRSRTHYEDLRQGYFQSISMRLTRMSWMAERPDTNSSEWTMTQLSGRPWSDPASYGRDDANPNNMFSTARSGQSQVFMGNLDAKKTINLGLPVQLLAGAKTRLTTFDVTWGGTQRWTFVGPKGSQQDPSTQYIAESRHLFDPKQGGNIAQFHLPFPDTNAMASLFQSNPEQFVPDTLGNFTNTFTTPRSLKEQIDAGYLEANTRWNQFRFNLGARFEKTRTIGRTYDILPAAAVRAAGYTVNTIPYVIYQYRNGVRPSTYGGYDNTFLSGGVKYSLLKNLVLQVAGNQSIGRPNYNNLAGVIAVNEAQQRVTLPNPDLKPETSNKFFVSAQYYIEPAGNFTVSAYQLNVKNMGTVNTPVSAAEAGYADEPEYTGYTFFQTSNDSGTRKIKGVDVEYSQQLVFLPGFWRGFSVFGSVSRSVPDIQIVDLVSKSANGGVRFSNHRFNTQLRFTWTAARPTSITATRSQWERERLMFDLSGGFKLNRTYEITLSGRNIFNQALESYSDAPGTIIYKDNFGAVWTLGIRGRF